MVGLIAGDGVCIRIKLPVLMLGSAANADVILDGLANLHCLFAPTPAGIALRSFEPETTLVNGDPTSAALLKDGDVISVGSHQFVLAWPIVLERAETETETDSVRKLLVQLAEERMANDAYAQTRSAALEQEAEEARRTLAAERRAVDEETQARVAAAEQQIQEARQKLAEEREAHELHLQSLTATAETHLKETQAKLAADRQENDAYTETKIAALQQQFQDVQQKLAEERAAVEAHKQTRALEIEQQLEQARQQLAAEHERLRDEAEASNQRMAAAWASLTAAQEQLAHDRRQVELDVATHEQLYATRKANLDQREGAIGANMQEAIEKLSGLNAEIAGLEQRATHARMVLADLEKQRSHKAPAPVKPIETEEWIVPLDTRKDGRSVDQLILQLRQQEQEVAKERQRLTTQLQNAAIEREHLQDQRMLVAEQIRQLEASRRQWQATESQTISELEKLAHGLEHREAELKVRENAIAVAETERRVRSEQLAVHRKELDVWQSALLAKETQIEPPILSSLEARRARLEEIVSMQRAA